MVWLPSNLFSHILGIIIHHHPNWRTHVFQRGSSQPSTRENSHKTRKKRFFFFLWTIQDWPWLTMRMAESFTILGQDGTADGPPLSQREASRRGAWWLNDVPIVNYHGIFHGDLVGFLVGFFMGFIYLPRWMVIWLVVNGCHQFYYFPILILGICQIIPIDEIIFFRGVAQPPTSNDFSCWFHGNWRLI